MLQAAMWPDWRHQQASLFVCLFFQPWRRDICQTKYLPDGMAAGAGSSSAFHKKAPLMGRFSDMQR